MSLGKAARASCVLLLYIHVHVYGVFLLGIVCYCRYIFHVRVHGKTCVQYTRQEAIEWNPETSPQQHTQDMYMLYIGLCLYCRKGSVTSPSEKDKGKRPAAAKKK